MQYAPSPGYLYRRSAASTSHRLAPSHTQAWLEAEAAFRQRHADRFTSLELAALEARGRNLREVHQLVLAIAFAKAKRFGSMAGLLASDPATAANTLASFARIAVGKAIGRRAFQRD
jgi:hypothetical protein